MRLYALLIVSLGLLSASDVRATKDDDDRPPIQVGFIDTFHNIAYNLDLEISLRQELSIELNTYKSTVARDHDRGGSRGAHMPPPGFLDTKDVALIAVKPEDTDNWELGNLVADFLESGRCVIVTMMSLKKNMVGRWRDGGYACIEPTAGGQAQMTFADSALGTVHVPDSPLLDGVETLRAKFRAVNTHVNNTTSGCELHASWADGSPAVAASTSMPGRRVDLNFFPVSTAAEGGVFWDKDTDGARLLRNAVHWCVAGDDDVPSRRQRQGRDEEGHDEF